MNVKRRAIERLRAVRGITVTTRMIGGIERQVTFIDVGAKTPQEQMACIEAWRCRLRAYGATGRLAQLP